VSETYLPGYDRSCRTSAENRPALGKVDEQNLRWLGGNPVVRRTGRRTIAGGGTPRIIAGSNFIEVDATYKAARASAR